MRRCSSGRLVERCNLIFCPVQITQASNVGCKSLLTFSKYQSVEINPCVSFRMLIFNGLPTLAEYTLKGLVLEIHRKKEKDDINII